MQHINFETASYNEICEANCPHCGIHLSNGLLHVDDEMANSDRTYYDAKDPSFKAGEYMCMGCDGHFGYPVSYDEPPASTPKPKLKNGINIEKNRETRNGVTRPSVGGACRAVWDACDGYLAETSEQPTVAGVVNCATAMGWNVNNARTEFYRWKKFSA